jgi:hypothetical protein
LEVLGGRLDPFGPLDGQEALLELGGALFRALPGLRCSVEVGEAGLLAFLAFLREVVERLLEALLLFVDLTEPVVRDLLLHRGLLLLNRLGGVLGGLLLVTHVFPLRR